MPVKNIDWEDRPAIGPVARASGLGGAYAEQQAATGAVYRAHQIRTKREEAERARCKKASMAQLRQQAGGRTGPFA